MISGHENSIDRYHHRVVCTVEVEGQGTIQDKGQVMPAVGVPHGMTNWVAQTNATEKKCLPPYYYYKTMIQGFMASHWMTGLSRSGIFCFDFNKDGVMDAFHMKEQVSRTLEYAYDD